jgi:ABC-type amino acid transport substrate-binding protein
VYRADRDLDLRSMRDPRLRDLRVGVHLIGDDGVNPPPAHALSKQGIVDNVVGYTIYGDYREPNPPAQIVDAVARGEIDLAAVWGPIGGYFARHASVPLVVVPITDTAAFAPLRFEFGIAMGVRKGEHALRAELNGILERRREDIRRLLDAYGVPRVENATARAPDRN